MSKNDKNIDSGDVVIESLDKSESNSNQYKENKASKEKGINQANTNTIKKIIKG